MAKYEMNSDLIINEYNIHNDPQYIEDLDNIIDMSNQLQLENQYSDIDNFLDILWENVMTPCIERGCILQCITTRDRHKFFNYMKKNSSAIKQFYRVYSAHAKNALDTSNSI